MWCRVECSGTFIFGVNTSLSQDGFIGFGGNVVRDVVKKQAPWYVYSMYDLVDELKKAPKKETKFSMYQSCDAQVSTATSAPMVQPLAAN